MNEKLNRINPLSAVSESGQRKTTAQRIIKINVFYKKFL